VTSQEVVQRDTLKVYDIKAPTSILELGLHHEEQISLLERVQEFSIGNLNSLTLATNIVKCSQKLHKQDLLSQSFMPSLRTIKWASKTQVPKSRVWLAKYPPRLLSSGTSIHPFAKLQCSQGTLLPSNPEQSR